MPPTPPPESESSLDRYLENRAGLILGQGHWRRGLIIMGVMGVIMLLMAVFILVTSIVTANPGMLAGAVGPSIAGFVNLMVAIALKTRMKPAMETTADLTPEARKFMAELMQKVYGWPYAWGASDPNHWNHAPGTNPVQRKRERRALRRMYLRGSWGVRQHAAKEFLSPEVFAVLDKAAFQHNRIAGALASGNPALARFAPTVKAAADQAMADMFQVAQLLDSFPESRSSASAKAEQDIEALTELADRLETMQSQGEVSLTPSSPSPVQAVLEELRMDQLARSELATQEVEKPSLDVHS